MGDLLQPVTSEGISIIDPSASNTKVVRNELVGGAIRESRLVTGPIDCVPEFDLEVDNNKLIKYSISGFETAVLDPGMNSKNPCERDRAVVR